MRSRDPSQSIREGSRVFLEDRSECGEVGLSLEATGGEGAGQETGMRAVQTDGHTKSPAIIGHGTRRRVRRSRVQSILRKSLGLNEGLTDSDSVEQIRLEFSCRLQGEFIASAVSLSCPQQIV